MECSNSKADGVINCSVCNLSFNSLDNFLKHSTTPEHALKVMLNQAPNTGTQSSNSVINNQLNATKCNVESTTGESILPELNDNKSYMSNYGSCEVCSKMFSGPEPYKQHLESQAHKKKVGLLQNQTTIQGILKCEPCNKSFSGQVPYTQHMISETHKKKLQNIQYAEKYLTDIGTSNSSIEKTDENKLWFCNVCNVQCSGMPSYEQHMAGIKHLKNEKRMQNQNNFAAMNGGMTPIMQINYFNDGKNSEKPEAGTQLVNGNYPIGSDRNDGKISEKSENMSQVVTASYQKDSGCDFVFPEKLNELVVSNDELGELVKIILPDQKIDFDELDKPKDSESKDQDVIKENENDKDDGSKKFQQDIENGFGDDLKKIDEVKEIEVYQTCKLCSVSLYDKDSAAEHFESMEHFEKKWGKKI